MKQCYFKKEVVGKKKKEGWKIKDVSDRRRAKDEAQSLVLMEKE